MRQRGGRTIATVWAACAFASLAFNGVAAGQGTGDCSQATATVLVQPTSPDTNPRVVDAVYCGAYLGPGSQAMVVVIAPQGGCVRIGGWVVFRAVDGVWQLSTDGYHLDGLNALTVEGTTITEGRDIHREADWVACSGTGGRQTRSWNWDGAAGLAAGPWVQAIPAGPAGEVLNYPRQPDRRVPLSFYVAGQPVNCTVEDARRVGVSCEYRGARFAKVSMNARGRLKICRDTARRTGCVVGNPGVDDIGFTLRSGQSLVFGRFACRARRSELRCVAAGGKGFRINRSGVHRVGA